MSTRAASTVLPHKNPLQVTSSFLQLYSGRQKKSYFATINKQLGDRLGFLFAENPQRDVRGVWHLGCSIIYLKWGVIWTLTEDGFKSGGG